jgi:hypothetical protein
MNRSISADFIKSFSIFGVVFIHGSGMLGYPSAFNDFIINFFRFCVPCFIILWAYFFEISYNKKDIKERRKYIRVRFMHLFIVYFLWSLIYFFWLVNWDDITLKKLITMHFSGYGFAGQYFFIILFQLILLYPFLRYMYLRTNLRNILLLIIFGLYIIYGYFESFVPEVFLKIGDRPFVFWLPYVYMGIFLCKNQNLKIPIMFSFTVLLIPVEFFVMKKLNLSHSVYSTPIVLLSSLLSCASLLQNRIEIKNEYILKFIGYIGKNTMTIFVANPLVILLFSLFITKNMSENVPVLEKIILPFISSFIVFFFCILIEKIIKKIRLNGVLN